MINSFILLKEEKKRIQKLYEATTASASGSYSEPMGFSVPGLGDDTQTLDKETTFIDGDNIVDGSFELNLDIDELSELLNLTDEDEEERIRETHKNNSTIKEQDDEPVTCISCIEKALGRYKEHAEDISDTITDMMKDGEKPSKADFVSLIKKTLYVLLKTRPWDIVPISLRLYGCVDICNTSAVG